MKLKKIDYVFILLIAIISIVSIDFLINKSHRVLIENVSKFPPFQNLYSGLLITFFVCLIGNLLPFPTPYTFVVCYSSLPFLSLNPLIPLLVGFIASLGCLIGEMGGYLTGRAASTMISEKSLVKLSRYQKILINHPKLAPSLVFIAALTPINDDMITVPLGILKYSFKKTVFWCWLGKLGLMLIFAYNLFSICSLLGGENWILSILTIYAITIFVYLMIKIDLIELYNKIFNKGETD
jgi:membrane protein YqaA with SNARE-associated domain